MKKSKEKLLRITGLSNEVFEIFRFEWNTFLLRLNCSVNPFKRRKIKKFTGLSNLKVNVGAGPFGEVGWVNIDVFYCKNISFTYDCRKKLPFRDGTVSKIRCEHVLEHMDIQYETPLFLKECHRVLTETGVLRIVVPDIEKFVHAYYLNEWSALGMQQAISPNWQPADILTHTFRQGGEHKFGYDFYVMKRVLEDAGFKKIERMEFGRSFDPELQKDQKNHEKYSLYVEAIKAN